MKLSSKLFLCILLAFGGTAFGDEDHPMSRFYGPEIELKTLDHSFAGKFQDTLAFGDVSTGDGHKVSSLLIKTHEEIIKVNFANQGDYWGGQIITARGDIDVRVVSVLRDLPGFEVSINGKKSRVKIEAEDFTNNHFINPAFVLEKDDGSVIAVKLEQGQTCWMYSLHLALMFATIDSL